MEYVPKGPWILEGEDKTLETEMFYDYESLNLKWKEMKKNGKDSDFFRHLNWLMNKAKKARSKRDCPHCGKRRADYFSVVDLLRKDDYKIDGRLVCCESDRCSRMVRGAAFASKVKFFRFTFENFADVTNEYGANGELLRLYASAFRLKSVTSYEIFRFFKEL